MDCESQKIHSGSYSVDDLHRTADRFPSWISLSSTGPMDQDTKLGKVLSHHYFNHGKTLVQSPGTLDIMSRSHIHGPSMAETPPSTPELTLEKSSKSVQTNPSNTRVQRSHPMVDQSTQCDAGSSMDLPSPGSHTIHRQFRPGLGGASRKPENIRTLEPGNSKSTHKCKRNESHMGDHEILSHTDNAQEYNDCNGQYIMCSIFKQTGRNQVTTVTEINSTNIAMVSGERDNPESQTYPRQVQCSERHVVPEGSNHINRVVHSPICDISNQEHLGNANDRPFRDKVQQQNTHLLLSNSRSTSPRGGRHVTFMEPHDSLCVPPTSHHDESTTENQTGQLHSVPDRPSLEQPLLVPNATQPTDRQSQKNHDKTKASKTATKQRVSHKPRTPQLTRLEIIKRRLKAKGLSERTAQSITNRCRTSTNQLYEAKWRVYTRWCAKNKIDPFKITEEQITEFFTYLSEDLHKGVSAMSGYRAVINSTIKLCTKRDVCNNFYISSQFRSFKHKILKKDKTIPKWNLTLVLNSLTKHPYEPIMQCPVKYLSWKTAFLTSFATAARVGELASISRKKLAHTHKWKSIILESHENFIAKNQDLTMDNKPRQFTIPALYDYAGPDLPDRKLCPVRAIRYYIHKTDKFRTAEKKALFISLNQNHQGDITANTLGSWIKNVIKLAYQNAEDQDLTLARATAHEVRALASSTAFKNNLSMKELNAACYWRGHSTFSNYYLREIAISQEDELKLPNVVAASFKIIR